MYSQKDEAGVLEALEFFFFFFPAQPCLAELF